jgi:tetratricopeptide (TPR) repeat protein
MAKIALRVYINEISDLIENNQLEEAVAHCLHILEEFPRHIETYRLLGKAHLEGKQYHDASDIFQRVLSSVPDDFIANVGMSIIREATGDLPAAIYHMERTFECQPSNQLIQEELRRLYGVRDGVQPAKTRLTRGALAHMYALGNLYDQAAAELIAALNEEPHRLDLYVLLAEMYFKLNKNTEAIETSKRILEKLPYSITANRILYLLVKDGNKSSEAETYFERWISMEPYAEFISDSYPIPDYVPEHMVTLERLESSQDQAEDELTYEDTSLAADSSATQKEGEEIGEKAGENELPDWLSDLSGESVDQADYEEEPSDQPDMSEPQKDQEGVPYWIGSSSSSEKAETDMFEGSFGEDEEIFDKAPEEGEAAQELSDEQIEDNIIESLDAEMAALIGEKALDEGQDENVPEWTPLPSDTAQQVLTDNTTSPEEESESPLDDLLQPIPESEGEEPGEDIPDGVKELSESGSENETVTLLDEEEEVIEEILDFSDSQPEEPEEAEDLGEIEADADQEIPDWATEMTPLEESPKPGEENITTPEETEETKISADQGIPDWAMEMTPLEESPILGEENIPTPEEAEGTETNVDQGIPEWVKQMSPLEESPIMGDEDIPSLEEPEEHDIQYLEEQITDTGDELDWLNELGQPAHQPPVHPINTDWLETYRRFEENSDMLKEPGAEEELGESEFEQATGLVEEPAEPAMEEGLSEEEEKEEWSQGDWLQYVPLEETPASQPEDIEEGEESEQKEQPSKTHSLETESDNSHDRGWLDKILNDEEEDIPAAESSETEEDADALFDEADLDWIKSVQEKESKDETPAEKSDSEVEEQLEDEEVLAAFEKEEEETGQDLTFSQEIEEEEFEWIESLPDSSEAISSDEDEKPEDWIGSLRETEDYGAEEPEPTTPDIEDLPSSKEVSPEEWLDSFEKETGSESNPELDEEDLSWIEALEERFGSSETPEIQPEPEIVTGIKEEEVPTETLSTEPDILEETLEQGRGTLVEESEESYQPTDIDQPIEPPSKSEEIPTWLKNLTKQEEENKPNWLININREADTGELADAVAPSSDVDEWLKYLSEPVPPATADEAMEADQEQEPESDQEEGTNLETDQDAAEQENLENEQKIEVPSDLDDIIEKYSYLIRKGRDLDQVIDIIQETLADHPKDSRLWQMLGDGFMRLDRLKEALDAYTKAEELLK